MAAWGVPPPPASPQYPPNVQTPQTSQYGGYYQPPELITKLYHKLSIIDYDLRCPIDLIHLIVKAAMRDPVIAQDIDLLVARRNEEFRPRPQNIQQHPPANSVLRNSVPPTGPQVQATGPQAQPTGPQVQPLGPQAQPPAPQSQQIAPQPQPTASQPQATHSQVSAQKTPGTPSASATGQAQGPASTRPSESREQTGSTSPPRDEPASNRQREGSEEIPINGVPLHMIRSPRTTPRCPRPAKSPTELQVPQKTHSSNAENDGNRRGNVIDPTDEEAASEPSEKPADYSKLLETMEKDLGWYGKYDNVSERRQITLGIEVSFKIGKLLERLRGYMENHHSFPNRSHILTVMREILMAVLQTEGSRVGHEVRSSAFEYDANFVWAVEKLTDDQKRKLRALDDGKWVKGLQELIELANAYCIFPELRKALLMIDTDAAAEDPGDSE
ncbi:hypothetical protein DL766_003311 [Monosporascus sp. MC13-8B]|uniref:Uncharacterized protein n=1 Tax=Monosporascus cannonballus TaxID=155416 RepID=A0ABY0H842_9PEZI|nr:hypothetical protein DL763_006530 [Monosporascus cannonballus]RYO87281.1 hypothetical protein DL762_004326 [Monosporascus cannonballus]RYP33722.1 hypothetical protein DL766_003311 [Monosporascus sp. MC13-8B]